MKAINLSSAILIAVPIPKEYAMDGILNRQHIQIYVILIYIGRLYHYRRSYQFSHINRY